MVGFLQSYYSRKCASSENEAPCIFLSVCVYVCGGISPQRRSSEHVAKDLHVWKCHTQSVLMHHTLAR